MRRISLVKYVPTPEKKEHYRLLHIWLKLHKEIEFKKLSPYGFAVNTATIPVNLIDEWISVSTFTSKE
jgi:hypothetical protein